MHGDSIIHSRQLVPQELPFEYRGDALDFDLGAGEVACIIGPDHAGKGTWLRTLCGLEWPASGSLYIKGFDTLDLAAEDWAMTRREVAYLHEDTALLSAANGLMNVLAPALYHQLDRELKNELLVEKALDLLEQIDPDINLDDLPAYLTKDHRYKIAVARALLLEPDVLALNNPFAHFNSDSKQRFQGFLKKRVSRGLSLLMVTHDIPYALSISDKIIFASREELFYFDSVQAMINSEISMIKQFLTLAENRART